VRAPSLHTSQRPIPTGVDDPQVKLGAMTAEALKIKTTGGWSFTINLIHMTRQMEPMIPLTGEVIKSYPVIKECVQVLEYYDGPLVSYLKTDENHYLHLWCDTDGETHRWMLARVAQADIEGLRQKDEAGERVTAYATVVPDKILDPFVYISEEGPRPGPVTRVRIKDIPQSYLPQDGGSREFYRQLDRTER